MLKLEKDNKILKNVRFNKGFRYKIITTANIAIFASLLASPYLKLNPKSINVESIEYDYSFINNSRVEGSTYTYEDYLLSECSKKIEEYSKIFNLREDIVLEAAEENIKNYNVIYVTEDEYESTDAYVILLCRDIIRNRDKYNIDSDINIYTEEDYIPTLTAREMVYKYADIFNVDRTFALTIACGESGYFEAQISTSKNNPYALNGSNAYIYNNLERGIIEGVTTIKLNYIDNGLDTYEELNNIYCGDGSDWSNYMHSVENEITSGKILFDEIENKEKILSY